MGSDPNNLVPQPADSYPYILLEFFSAAATMQSPMGASLRGGYVTFLPSRLHGGGYREELEKDLGIRICKLRHQVARIEPRWRSPSLVVRPYVEPVA